MSQETMIEIENRLQSTLKLNALEVIDESHFHIGHAGAEDGKGHYKVVLQGHCFDGLSLIKRHKLIYGALGELMQTKIHALSINIIEG